MTQIDAQPVQGDAGDDWFGDGTAFNSQAELAAALHAMTAASVHVVPPQSDDVVTDENASADAVLADDESDGEAHETDVTFELVEHRPAPGAPARPVKAAPPGQPAEPQVATWSVRVPGVQLLPQRQRGRSGWTMQNSVRILRQADELMLRLREEAIVTTFSATARALRGEDAAAS